jgi:hypothetical protein
MNILLAIIFFAMALSAYGEEKKVDITEMYKNPLSHGEFINKIF